MNKNLSLLILSLLIISSGIFILSSLHIPSTNQTAAVSDFDGNLVGQYLPNTTGTLSTGDTVNLGGMSAITISLWVKADSIGSFSILSKRHSASPWYSFNISIDTQSGNRAGCNFINSASSQGNTGGGSGTLTAGSWHHIVCVYDGSTVSVYTDGAKSGFSANLTGTLFDSDGSLIGPNSSAFQGLLGDIRIYNTALSDSKIGELYTLGAPQASTYTPPADTSPPTTTTPPSPPATPPATSPTTSGSIISAASCSQQDVQAAINTATDGQTVIIPVGTCTWSIPVTFCKSIILKGAGEGQTHIIDNTTTAWNQAPIWIDSSCSSKTFRITGFTFSDSGVTDSLGFITIRGNDLRFRLDNIQATNFHELFLWSAGNRSYGVVDHIRFDANVHAPAFLFREDDHDAAWSRPMTYGTDQAVFVEDSTFDYSGYAGNVAVTDCSYGARYTFRHNQVSGDASVANHGLDSVIRSCLQMEVYDNSFATNRSAYRAIYSRGGSAIIFNNRLSGNWSSPLGMTNYRSCGYAGALVQAGASGPNFGTCDGTNPLDGNTPGMKGWPCKDQIGRGTNQSYEPVYEWDNTMNGTNANITVNNTWAPLCVDPQPSDHIKAGRDYFNNTPRPGYIPYTYPHPMTLYGFTGDNPSIPLPTSSTPPAPPITPPTLPTQPTPTADFNHDGKVNSLDFSLLQGSWNQSSTTYDLNHDGTVNTLDYSLLIQQWTG